MKKRRKGKSFSSHATVKQEMYLHYLLANKIYDSDCYKKKFEARKFNTKYGASLRIDYLKKCPWKPNSEKYDDFLSRRKNWISRFVTSRMKYLNE